MLSFLRHINEDKRKTEAQRQFFDVVYEVDGCPVSNSSKAAGLLNDCSTLFPLQKCVRIQCNGAGLKRLPVLSCKQALIQPLN